jgi:integrase
MSSFIASSTPTVAQLVDLYAADYLPTKAPGTQRQQRQVFVAVLQAFGERPVTELTPALLRAWRDELQHRYAPGTARRFLDTFSSVLTVAVQDYEMLTANPMRKIRKPPASPGRVRYLTDPERARLLEACQTSRTPALFPVVMIALTTGARKMEIMTLCWPEVDLERGWMRLLHTKNGERRAVPLAQITQEVLRAWAKSRRYDVEWVFPRLDGTGPVNLMTAWQGAVYRAGLENFHFHDLRHTAASYLAMSGASMLEIAEILGHKTLAMVKRYSHFAAGHTAQVVERMVQQMLRDERKDK